MANTGFDLINSKKCLHSFSSVFVFKQAKEKVCLIKVQPLKIIIIRVTLTIFWGPATSEKATLRLEILELMS